MKSSRNTIRKVAYAATMLASASIAFASFGATDWYVDGKDGDNGNSGTSPTSAFKTIARAVQALSANGDSINIADCDTPYAISKTIVPTFNCRIRSISGNPEKVVIDAGGQCPCLRVPYTATAADNKVVSVCGITFRNGESTSTEAPVSINGAAWSFEAGGIAGSRYTMVSNCVVESCRMRLVGNVDLSARRFSGGGIGLCGYSSSSNVGKPVSGYPDIIPGVFDTIVTNCSVFCSLQNTSTARLSVCGGGVGIAFAAARGLQVLGCGASNTCNRADSYSCNGGGLLVGQGARVEQSVVRGCRVDRVPGQTGEQNKDGLASGGGVAFQCSNGDNDTGVLRDSLIEENVSTGATGGGVYAYSFMRLVGCTVRKNRIDSPVTTDSSYCGGTAIYMDSVKNNAEISNCVIEQNEDVTTAGGHSGSVVFFYGTEKMTLRDSVVRNNTGYTASALKFFNVNGSVVTNCVVSGNVSTGPVGPLHFYNNTSLCIQECAFVSNRSDTASAAASANGNGIIYFSNGSKPVYSNIVIRSSLFLGTRFPQSMAGCIASRI